MKTVKEIFLVPDEVSSARLDICKQCDKFRRFVHTCNMCGCYMPAKVKLKSANCPAGKWSSIDTDDENNTN